MTWIEQLEKYPLKTAVWVAQVLNSWDADYQSLPEDKFGYGLHQSGWQESASHSINSPPVLKNCTTLHATTYSKTTP